jgi:hypothetical protein
MLLILSCETVPSPVNSINSRGELIYSHAIQEQPKTRTIILQPYETAEKNGKFKLEWHKLS